MPQQANQISSYTSSPQRLTQPPSQWSMGVFTNPAASRGQPPVMNQSTSLSQRRQPGPHMSSPPPGSIPYAFGQLPNTANLGDPKSQHPIPGSFNRHAFNPQTQSFVPGNATPQMQQPISLHDSPHIGNANPQDSPRSTYDTYPAPEQQYSNTGMEFNMAHQGSNSSIPSYYPSRHMPNGPMVQSMLQGMPQTFPSTQHPHAIQQTMPQNATYLRQSQFQQVQPSNDALNSHLPHFGNPSTLPPKPPTGL